MGEQQTNGDAVERVPPGADANAAGRGSPGAGDPLAQLAPEQREDLARIVAGLELESALQADAAANPLPGALWFAFDPEPQRLAGFTLRPLVAFDFVVLRKIESPLLTWLRGLLGPAADRPAVEFSDDQECEMIYQFIMPVGVVRRDIERGRERFREQARARLADTAAVIRAPLIAAVQTELARSWSTAISYCPAREETETTITAPGGARDGLGWWLLYVAGLARHLPLEQVLYQLPMAQGRALLNAWKESDPWVEVDRESAGYLRQEIERLKPRE